jgi:hypothetical protein
MPSVVSGKQRRQRVKDPDFDLRHHRPTGPKACSESHATQIRVTDDQKLAREQ